MPDPCPHVSRLDLIAARLSGDPELIANLENCEACNEDAAAERESRPFFPDILN